MKKHLAFLLIVVFLNSCSNTTNTDQDEIFGSWKLIAWYDDNPIDINQDGQASTDLFSQWNGCKKQSILVLENDYSGRIIYTGPGDNDKCPPGFQTGNIFNTEPWKLENGVLVFIGDDYFDSYEIITLNKNTLVLKGSGQWTCCDPEISYYTDGYLQFSRQ
ncbi:Lipocalin-like domain-containing protein [Muriicola jejuensis]|uniref:Lipocalin-like domain-containing protein n=1 Tax=Muriicola jejuensis TaxID=504488 RepID=A0A6P0UIR3_9FLAO|nr:lipocalin family protein [Muriicola jejuensis]NER11788.1 hypothetical protein [Muriicola jejuensis]SMP27365.1 Lipocalin-like domain-containing protein [Muriicola jejuensis]